MRRLLIVQTGNTHPHIAAWKKDFVDWFITGLELDPACLSIVDPRTGASLPPYEQVAGTLITGSHAMVTERPPWSERIAAWLPGALERDIPVLGICYGHQLLAQALGGEVRDNPKGLDYGTVEAILNEKGQSDPLLGGLGPDPRTLLVQVGHVQTVTRLPQNAELLAASARDDHLAFRVGSRAWGLQFHPEMDASAIREYIRCNREQLAAEGQDTDLLLAACADTPASAQILRRFGQMVFS